jgi:quinol monooxygenase YgiN
MIVIVQHHVRDFEAWQPVFEDHRPSREEYGCTGHLVYRGLDDPNDVTVILQFLSRERGEAFVRDPSLKKAMERGGVDSEPRTTMLDEVEAADYTVRRAA